MVTKVRVARSLVAAAAASLIAAAPGCSGESGGENAPARPDRGDAGDTGSPDATGAADAGDAGGRTNAALDAKCTPTLTLELEDTGPKGQLFIDAVPDPESFVQATGRTVCQILYRKVEEVRDANHITLIIRDDPQYPGWKSGDVGNITVMISTDHLADVDAKGGDVASEVRGILLHEMTHMYQNDDKAPGEGTYAQLPNVIEGIADFVRIRAGYAPAGAQPSKTGSWDDQGYWKPAFFLLWIDGRHPDFLYRLNLGMVAGDGIAWSPDAIATLTGQSVADLWAEYATASCCAGSTQSCCN